MAKTFEIPESPKTYNNSLTEFLGVDYNNPLDSDVRHSPKMWNMIQQSGYLKKRYGVKIKKHIANAPIYGIWQYDVPADSKFKELFIVHCGDKLYEVSTDFETVVHVMSDLAENDSYGMFLADKLVILDGKRAIVYGKNGETYFPNYMDSVAYIPTTTIGLNPQGFGGTSYEDVNLLTQYRINEFMSDGVSVNYYTDSSTISADKDDTAIYILSNSTGVWEELSNDKYTIDVNNIITFNEAPEAPIVEGRDNIRIKFKSTTADQSNMINKCRFCVPFGYQGNNQRLFYSGNPDHPNVDWHSDLVAAQPDPTYVPDTSFAVIGIQPISGYLRLSDGTLGILKRLSDTDCSIYYRTSNAQGKWDIFPLLSGTKNVGCFNIYTCANVGNYALFLSEQGVYQSVTGDASATLERYADNKSYYINKKLLEEENLENSKAISLGQYYWLFCPSGNVYVGDTLKWTETKINTILQYQWYPLKNIDCRSVMKWNNELVIGDNYGNIKMFGDDYTDDVYEDSPVNVDSYFETVPLDFTDPIEAKTTREFTINYIAPEDSRFEFGYKTIDEDEIISDEIYKKISGNLPINYDEDVNLPYGTMINFDTDIIPNQILTEGFSGYYYGAQTDTIKNIFGIYNDSQSNLSIGIFTIKNFDSPGQTIEPLKLFFSNGSWLLNKFSLKKVLHGNVNKVSTDLNIPTIEIDNWSFDNVFLSDPILNGIPQTMTLKEKARKVMFLKFFVQSDELACEFDRIFIKYRKAGKYRGE